MLDVLIHSKFKVSDSEKYRGTTCPKSHLTKYYKKMVAHAHDDELLIHFSEDSLANMELNWYMHLKYVVSKE